MACGSQRVVSLVAGVSGERWRVAYSAWAQDSGTLDTCPGFMAVSTRDGALGVSEYQLFIITSAVRLEPLPQPFPAAHDHWVGRSEANKSNARFHRKPTLP